MKISVAIPVLDLASPAPASPVDGAAAGRGFETAVRAVAERASDPKDSAPRPPERERVSEGRKDPAAASTHAPASKDDEDQPKDDTSAADASASAATPTADLLGRLLAGSGLTSGAQAGKTGKDAAAGDGSATLTVLSSADADALAAAASAAADVGTTFDGALEERLVITPLGAGSAEGKAQGADKGRTGVNLEVLHMETHFEPRVDDVVLVEGAAAKAGAGAAETSAGALGGVLSTIRGAGGKAAQASDRSGDSNPVHMRFDETLARLSNGERASGADEDASDKRGAKDRRAEAKTANDQRLNAPAARAEASVEIETSVAVPTSGSMTGQIADRIVDAFRSSSGQERAADAAPGTTHLRMTAGGAALKTLTIQLQPENLGKLEVSMRLVEGRLTLELAASSAETATALAHDRAGLKKLLEHAGFSMDEASISIVARDSTAAMTKAGAGQEAGGQGQSASSGDGQTGSGSPSGERGSARDPGSEGREPAPGRRGRGEGEAQLPARQRSSVFL